MRYTHVQLYSILYTHINNNKNNNYNTYIYIYNQIKLSKHYLIFASFIRPLGTLVID